MKLEHTILQAPIATAFNAYIATPSSFAAHTADADAKFLELASEDLQAELTTLFHSHGLWRSVDGNRLVQCLDVGTLRPCRKMLSVNHDTHLGQQATKHMRAGKRHL